MRIRTWTLHGECIPISAGGSRAPCAQVQHEIPIRDESVENSQDKVKPQDRVRSARISDVQKALAKYFGDLWGDPHIPFGIFSLVYLGVTTTGVEEAAANSDLQKPAAENATTNSDVSATTDVNVDGKDVSTSDNSLSQSAVSAIQGGNPKTETLSPSSQSKTENSKTATNAVSSNTATNTVSKPEKSKTEKLNIVTFHRVHPSLPLSGDVMLRSFLSEKVYLPEIPAVEVDGAAAIGGGGSAKDENEDGDNSKSVLDSESGMRDLKFWSKDDSELTLMRGHHQNIYDHSRYGPDRDPKLSDSLSGHLNGMGRIDISGTTICRHSHSR